jgi:hypothetical protein
LLRAHGSYRARSGHQPARHVAAVFGRAFATLRAQSRKRSFNLAGLAPFLETESRKLETDGHGQAVTDNYLFYAKQDVQVTWEPLHGVPDGVDFRGMAAHRRHGTLSAIQRHP